MRIDLNADLGESPAPVSADEAALLTSVTSINVACGFHAGTPSGMREIVRLAKSATVAVGAHPSLSDRDGFGRRVLSLRPAELEDIVLYQVSALAGIARAEGVALRHVKPHGALYHMASSDDAVAEALVGAVRHSGERLRIIGFPGSRLIEAATRAGVPVLAEAFADRAYAPDGTLVPRDRAGAVIHHEGRVVARVLRMLREHRILAIDERTDLDIVPDTICIHGDTPGAGNLARILRAALAREGIDVVAPA
jgi:UPF0271 protein